MTKTVMVGIELPGEPLPEEPDDRVMARSIVTSRIVEVAETLWPGFAGPL